MDPILNSPSREAIRKSCEEATKRQLYSENVDFSSKQAKWSGISNWPLIAAVIFAFATWSFLGAVSFGIAIAIGLASVIWYQVKMFRFKKESREKRERISAEGEARARQEIDAYNDGVKAYSQKALQNSASIQPMADYVTDKFQYMISHVNAAANVKYIETDFTYEVKRDRISFYYESQYSNPLSDYNFDQQRFRNLNSDMECEGLARALAVMTIRSVMASYPPHYVVGDKIPLDHVDARVTLHFKAVNKNFQTAKDIF